MGFQLWIKEPDKAVWHRVTRGEGGGLYVAECGWTVSLNQGLMWPQKSNEAGPAVGERCHDCVADRVTP